MSKFSSDASVFSVNKKANDQLTGRLEKEMLKT